LVTTNAKVITVDIDFSIKQAVAVKDGRIATVGTDHDVQRFIGPDTRVLDLKGKVVLPGINESHMHVPFFGATRPPLSIDLTYPAVKSIPELVEALRHVNFINRKRLKGRLIFEMLNLQKSNK
jgi:hypothetical protein